MDGDLGDRLARLEDRLARRESRLAPRRSGRHADGPAPAGDGAVLPGTRVRCSDEVARRLAGIAVPAVREMVIRRVADAARADAVALVDVRFFERAASF